MTRRAGDAWLRLVGLVCILAALGSWGFSWSRARHTVAETARLADVLQLAADSRVADVGAGDGRFAIRLAQVYLTEGYIYATEIDRRQLTAIRGSVREAGLENVTILESRSGETGLPPACCDAVFLRTVYHHLTSPAATAADLFAAVKPGGHLAVIDFPPRDWLSLVSPVDGLPENRGGHGIPADVVVNELTAAGFRLEDRISDWGGSNYCVVFVRP